MVRFLINLLVFNLAMDADDSALANQTLAHSVEWVNALARRCDHVSVITMFAGKATVESNVTVHSLGKEHDFSEPRRLARFYRLVGRVLRERPIDACFAHMAELFAVLFQPVARAKRIPVLLWYAHSSVTPTLRLAHAVVERCVTSTPIGFRLKSDKLFILGQGIDVGRFAPPVEPGPAYETSAVSVGRITPVKRIDEMLEALTVLRDAHGIDLRLHLVGGPSTIEDREHAAMLRQTSENLGLDGLVSFEGPLAFNEVPSAYHRGGLFLNLSETGSIDKAILESMASGCVPISRNTSFEAIARDEGLEWLVPGAGPEALADCIVATLDRLRSSRAETVAQLRGIVVDHHSLDRLADALMEHLEELVASSR